MDETRAKEFGRIYDELYDTLGSDNRTLIYTTLGNLAHLRSVIAIMHSMWVFDGDPFIDRQKFGEVLRQLTDWRTDIEYALSPDDED